MFSVFTFAFVYGIKGLILHRNFHVNSPVITEICKAGLCSYENGVCSTGYRYGFECTDVFSTMIT